MADFKRMNKNSKLEIYTTTKETLESAKEKILAMENDRTMILQVVALDNCITIVEYISKLEEMEETPSAPAGDIDFENYLETIINKDPFGGVWSGKTIKQVFEAGDEEWVARALKEMKNAFIRDRIEYIIKRGGYGKIRN